VRRQKTFEAITRVLDDGAWHTVDDLTTATKWPEDWTKELEAEGLIETQKHVGGVLVRLRNPERISVARLN
jgi:hypothetical protein